MMDRLEWCENYYHRLAVNFNLKMDSIQRRMTSKRTKIQTQRCESSLKWDGQHLWERPTEGTAEVRHIHQNVVYDLRRLMNFSRPPAFEADIHTADNGFCEDCNGKRVIVEHSRSPLELVSRSLLLPIAPDQVPYWSGSSRAIQSASRKATQGQSRPSCIWRGSSTGYAYLQNMYNRNRSTCSAMETDRQCLIKLKVVDAKFGKDAKFMQYDCILAVDGNSFSSIFKTALSAKKLVIRVGGVGDGGERLSSYEWFEPFLRNEVHYIRTTLDSLQSTVARVKTLPVDRWRAIADRGHQALKALVTDESISCYTWLEVARHQTDGLQNSITACDNDATDR
jgi:hypothetical protein